jgi:Protein of unknown function (DUF3592)
LTPPLFVADPSVPQEFRKGNQITMYYDPKDPSNSTIVKGSSVSECGAFGVAGAAIVLLRAIARR